MQPHGEQRIFPFRSCLRIPDSDRDVTAVRFARAGTPASGCSLLASDGVCASAVSCFAGYAFCPLNLRLRHRSRLMQGVWPGHWVVFTPITTRYPVWFSQFYKFSQLGNAPATATAVVSPPGGYQPAWAELTSSYIDVRGWSTVADSLGLPPVAY